MFRISLFVSKSDKNIKITDDSDGHYNITFNARYMWDIIKKTSYNGDMDSKLRAECEAARIMEEYKSRDSR